MSRKLTAGVAIGALQVPQTINIVSNSISTTETDANLVLSPNGSGAVDLVAAPLSTTGTITVGTISNNQTGNTASFNNLNCTGLAVFNEIGEISSALTGATGTVTHNFNNGGIFFHSSIAANFTANFTNVPTDNNRVFTMVLMLDQGATGYIPNAIQIDGNAQTIRWAYNTVPTPSVNKIDIASFSLIRSTSTWFVVGNFVNYN
jgi:hypothetical protein